MLAAERHRLILDRVQQNGSVRVAVLARELAVTEETIRRDLEKLGAEGALVRTHGGAVALASDRTELPFGVRDAVHLPEKRAIARRAAQFILDGDVIALDASSSAYELAKVLPERSISVVTNSLAIANVLADATTIRVILTGGALDGPSMGLVGALAEENLARFNIKKLFFSCQGLDLERGLSVTADEHGRMKRRMLELAESAFLLIDHSKFGVRAVEFFAEVSSLDVVVTDNRAPASAIEKVREAGCQVVLAGEDE